MVVFPRRPPAPATPRRTRLLDGALVCHACGPAVADRHSATAGDERAPRPMVGRLAQTAVMEPPPSLGTRPLELSKLRPVEWLWSGRLVRGVIDLLAGEEGVGKSALLTWLIAQLTRGELPGAFEGTPARVLWVGDEDSWERVVGPRLYAAGADLALVRDLTMGSDESALLDIVRSRRASRAAGG